MKNFFIFVALVAVFTLGWHYWDNRGAQPRTTSNVVVATTTDVALYVGQTGQVGDLRITFNALLNDYRCPIDVQCIEAGAINTNVTFTRGEKTVTKNMPSDEVPQQFEGYAISIIDSAPSAHSQKEIKQNEYRVTFRAVPN